jgi:hypothetical protein
MRRLSSAIGDIRYQGSAAQTAVQRQIQYAPDGPAFSSVNLIDSRGSLPPYFQAPSPNVPTDELLTSIERAHRHRMKTDPVYASHSKAISDCVQNKLERKYIILRTGHGGRNLVTKYKPRQDC